jgi:hypothetical protein
MAANTNDTYEVSVKVDLARNVEGLRADIISAIASKVLYGVSYDEDGDEYRTTTKIGSELRSELTKALRDEVTKVAGPLVEAALAEGVQLTDQYGSPRGEKQPLRTVIVEEAHKALNKRVEVRDNYSRSESVVQQVIRDEVQRALAEDLKAVVKAERQKVEKAVRDEAASIITDAVRRATRAVA